MSTTRHYEASSRNPAIVLGALACFGAASLSQMHGASPMWLLVIGLPGVAALAAGLLASGGGWTVSEQLVRFHLGRDWELRLTPEQIHHASRIPHTDGEGTEGIQIAMTNGQTREVPDQCMGRPDTLIDALESVGVEVRDL